MFINISLVTYLLSFLMYVIFVFTRNAALKKVTNCFYYIGIAFLGIALFLRGIEAGHLPLSNTYETLILLAFLVATIYLFFSSQDKEKILAAGNSLLIVVILAVTSLVTDNPRPLVPALQSNWLTIHVLFCFVSYASLAFAFIVSLINISPLKKRISLDLDIIEYKMIMFGYAFLILGITSGSVWGNQAWGTYWSWDPKETWSLITFFIYTIYLHLNQQSFWSNKKASLVSIVGFLFIVFTYFGVNYFLAGLHSYA
jgi:ABC-type transport system involved in cytochrome c biogenesis permease subunit